MELAATIDAGMLLVKASYNLEGGGPLVLTCHDTISALNIAALQTYYPNLDAIAAQISANPREKGARDCIQPGIANTCGKVHESPHASITRTAPC